MTDANTVPVQVLREYGSAIRGDWGDIDGRTVRAVLDEIADAIEGKEPWASRTLTRWREDIGLCPSGDGHWTVHCQPSETRYAGTDDEYTYGCGNEATRW